MRLKKVCADCPFRRDRDFLGLSQERVREIADSLRMGETFQCHKTVYGRGEREQLCAGALSTMEREGNPHQVVQVMERLGIDVSSHLDSSAQPVYNSLDEWAESVGDNMGGRDRDG